MGFVGVGGGPVSLVSIPNAPGAVGSFLQVPVFSPDGTKVAFERYIDFPSPTKSERGIFTVGVDGSGLTKILSDANGPSWQPVPPPPPPPPAPAPVVAAKSTVKKGKIRLDRKNQAVVGQITCGSSPCALKALSSKLKVGKETCGARVKLAKALAPTKSTPVKVTIKGKCLKTLKEAGKGMLVTKVRVTDAAGKKVSTFKSKLLPPKPKKAPRHKK